MTTKIINRALNFSQNQLNLNILSIGLFQAKLIFEVKRFSSDASQSFVPIKFYENADTMKLMILKENKGLSGIYRWVNNVNGKSYIGSAINLNVRLNEHYKGNKSNILLQQAFNKYGLDNFSLEIIEYYENNIKTLIEKEQFFLNLLKPEYNVLKNAGSCLGLIHSLESREKMSEIKLGFKHSLETREKMSEVKLGKDNPFFRKTHTEETKLKMSEAKKGLKHPFFFGKTHSEMTKEKISQAKGITIYVYNLKIELLYTFTSATRAGLHFKSKAHTILKYVNSGEIFKSEYILSLKILSPPSK